MSLARCWRRAARPVVVGLVAGLALASSAGTVHAGPGTLDGATSESFTAAATAERRAPARITRVLVVSIDGLSTTAIRRLGPRRAPVLHRLIRRGASTLNARTEYEQTNTLPNHTGMVTGRPVDTAAGGHGVTWNDDRASPATVSGAAGENVASVFSVVESAGRSSAMFVSKQKLMLFDRSWRIDRAEVQASNPTLVTLARRDLLHHSRAFTFVHLSLPDSVGHRDGYMSHAYLSAVATTDRTLGRLVRTVNRHRKLKRHLTLIVTSDHGGRGLRHNQADRIVNYRIPFIVWGTGVAHGADLYALNRDYAFPGRSRPTYAAARPPVRNGAVANLATDLLGLPPVSGSLFNVAHDLDVTR